MSQNKEDLKNKIIYRASYRGTKEMDILMTAFVKSFIDELNEDTLKILDKFVNMDDETLISFKKKNMEFYLSNETIKRSKFKFLKPRDVINLELPLKYGTKISGHICQGHVDTVGKVLRISKVDKSYVFEFEIPKKERKHLIEKASISVNGISLTISKVTKKGFQIWIIPHTYKETNLSTLKKSSLVNIEIDILSKYVRNYFNEKK